MHDIKLGALTSSVQKSSSGETEETIRPSKKQSLELKPEAYSSSRIQLSEENKARIDLLLLSEDIKFRSRTQLVNVIIAQYFDEHSETISSSIQSLFEKL